MRFEERVAVVTGGGSGMGAATAKLLAREGAAVVVADVNVAGGQQVQQEITEGGGRAIFHATDVSDESSAQSMVRRAVHEFGRLDLAANVAGIPQKPLSLADTSLELWDKVHAVNDRGLFLCLQAEIPEILSSGGGAVVNVSSLNGVRGFARMTAYGSSKFGAVSTSLTLAAEFADQNIRINAIAPGSIDTPMLATLPAETRDAFAATLPSKRLGTAEEVASVIAFLLSEEASYVNGAVIPVDGGWLVGS
ncbi:SDR family oxidoreductase [Streptomyces sp. NPDC005708]|uniref:SDR family NAD(P)-dependent oxidoreductase n=1 Tax=Streptomyces sp. NPDC005708 TaxID=3154564 RepID=UPI0033D52EFD